MSRLLVALFCVISVCESRKFVNPVTPNKDTSEPGVIYLPETKTYYAVTTDTQRGSNKIPIHTSTDLQTWTLAGYIFNGNNVPSWSTNEDFWDPEIHQLGSDKSFRLYFTTTNKNSKLSVIGVAVSTSVTGPYYTLDRPIVSHPSLNVQDPTMHQAQDGYLYLFWRSDTRLRGRKLNSDGLSFAEGSVETVLIDHDLNWEGGIVSAPWIHYRSPYYYMFYSGEEGCADKYAIGVARSSTPLGSYEKRQDPILAGNTTFRSPGHCSVVNDVGVKNGLAIVYHAFVNTADCHINPRFMCVKSLVWNGQWPQISD